MANEIDLNAILKRNISCWEELFAKYEKLDNEMSVEKNERKSKFNKHSEKTGKANKKSDKKETCSNKEQKNNGELFDSFDSLKEGQIAQNSKHESQKESFKIDIFDLSLVGKESDLFKSEKHNCHSTISISSYNLENDFARKISIEEPLTYEILKESLIDSLNFRKESELLDEIFVVRYSCSLANVFQQIFSITEYCEEKANLLATLFEQICIVFQKIFKVGEHMAKVFFDKCCKFFTLLQGICAQLYV